ncbi:MAG TPA: DUF4124 domain-containing protein [Steroidobacteraceae bacterium]|jgi:hypothetical protein|nr:DUF4124 domain-containing protein [Steroidobacteraceae bacterium]
MRRLITCGLAVLTVLVLSGGGALATTLYRWVDAQGVVHYSDTPQPGAQKVQVQDAQTYKALPAPRIATPDSGGSPADDSQGRESAARAYQCSITAPMPDQSFFSPESVSISVNVVPSLSRGDKLQVTLDGNALPMSRRGGTEVQAPDRGAHTINATVLSADGKTACTAEPVTFNVERPSLLSPQSPAHH